MAKLRIGLALLAVITLGLSLALPGVDAPETSYDESESLPYENTPSVTGSSLFSPTLLAPSSSPELLFVHTHRPLNILSSQTPELLLQSIAPEILSHSLRC
jgi:hypothetical protein